MKVGCVDLAAQQKAPHLLPAERQAVVAAILGKRLQVPGRVGQLQDARLQPVRYRTPPVPWTGLLHSLVCLWVVLQSDD